MDLFNDCFDHTLNLLPYDGEVYYFGQMLSSTDADAYFDELMRTIPWHNDQAIIAGKRIITARKVAWYGNDAFDYTYSGTTKRALPWTSELLQLKTEVERITQKSFNSCLLNLYNDGETGMAWHSDDEAALGKNTTIASLSLGAQRRFAFKHKKTAETNSFELAHGSLLLMQGETQTHWLHSLPKVKNISQPRINLTFRTIIS